MKRQVVNVNFFSLKIILLISERKEEGEGETSMMREDRLAASCTPHTRDRAWNQGMGPNRESNVTFSMMLNH